jgi:hypothetical protein
MLKKHMNLMQRTQSQMARCHEGRNRFPLNAYHFYIPYLEGYKNIIVHFVFEVKHDLCHKACLVAGGHLTDPNTDGTYSGVVNLRTMRISITVGEINGLKLMVGDVSSAYLEAYTQEKVCFIAGTEFGPLQGHLLVIDHALYGLRRPSSCHRSCSLWFAYLWCSLA